MHQSLLETGLVIEGKWELTRLLGAGGFGRVYEAWHIQLDHPVAIKFLDARRGGAELRQRFLEEARLMAGLASDHLVRASDYGELPDGTPYFVMDLVKGRTLRDHMRERMSVSRSLEILEGVLLGLSSMHERGVVHADIKPENIVIGDDDGKVWVLDFGLARASDLLGGAEGGTPPYMAPELLIEGVLADESTDVYSVGVLSYEMFTGRLPRGHGRMDFEKMRRAWESRPTEDHIRMYRPDVPKALDQLVRSALSRESRERPESAKVMLNGLRGFTSSVNPREAAVVLPGQDQSRALSIEPLGTAEGSSGRRSRWWFAPAVVFAALLAWSIDHCVQPSTDGAEQRFARGSEGDGDLVVAQADAGDGATDGDVADNGDGGSVSPDDDLRVVIEDQIEHRVIPEESLDAIARRYGVSVEQIAEWNLLKPDVEFLQSGTSLEIKRPKMRPLPQQKIRYELEPEDTSWAKLSKRFGVSVEKLRAYNPTVGRLERRREIFVWIDPRPHEPKGARIPIPSYAPERSAQSVGSPNEGKLEGGIQLPDNPALYIRRYPYLMWGSGYLLANVQDAVARFHLGMDFDGTLVLSDISKQDGGYLYPPHASHQAGRDIDIWLPTLRGVFKTKYLTEEGDAHFGRRPNPEEVDWYATWGLIKALLDTNVENIFITYEIQPNIYHAAKYLGASDEELDYALQWPRNEGSGKGVVMHAPGHTHHMHVRFKCAPYEARCEHQPPKSL